jgi:secondary thiamine-phosphate synthase enzyme
VGVLTKRFDIVTGRTGDTIDLIHQVDEIVRFSGIKQGIVHVFAPHATVVFPLTELESNLKLDIRNLLDQMVPASSKWNHPGNAHSHIRSMLIPPDRTLPVRDGRLVTGTGKVCSS